MRNKYILSLFFFVAIWGYAQEIQVNGIVMNQDNYPIPGVSVVEKGTANGVVTDFDGNFSITINKGNVLAFTYVGFIAREIIVNSTDLLNVILVESISELEQVVVVAYGSQTKKSITGAVLNIKAEEITSQPSINFTNSLQGLAPGLQTFNSNGQPGAAAEFLIRGIGSANAGIEPLIVVDGAVYEASLASINPNDIESVSVLKDASASSIYGSRAGNGVVLITTKAGTSSKTTYTISTSIGISEVTNPNNFRVANASEYVEYYREAIINAGGNPNDTTSGFFLPVTQEFDTDWVDEAFQSGIYRTYDFAAQGGNESTNFYTSLGYNKQTGTIVATGFERITGLIRINHRANKRFNFGGSAQVTYRNQDNLISNTGRSGQLSGAFQTAPIEPILATPDLFGTNGEGAGYNFAIPSNASHNPVATAVLNSDNNQVYTINTSINAGYKFTNWLSAEIRASHLINSIINKEVTSKLYRAENQGGTTVEERGVRNVTNVTGSLKFIKQLGNDHGFSLQLGGELFRDRFNSLEASANNFAFENLNNVGNGGVATAEDITSDFDGLNTVGFFGRLKYDYKEKLFLELSGRRDGASNFGPENRWGNFGAVGASYILTEDLFQDSSVVNLLKIRSSYGTSGNNDIGNFLWRDLYNIGVNSITPSGNVFNGVRTTRAPNPNLKWEKNIQLDIGLDFGLLNNRITGSIDYFRRNSQDLIFALPLSLTTGFSSNTINSTGEFLNTGMEFDMKWFNIRSKTFNWSTNVNYAFYDQEIKKLPDGEVINPNDSELIWREGERSDSWYLQRYDGVDPTTGEALYLDADGNQTTTPDSDNRVITGQTTPDSYGSITNTFTYKGISFSFMFYGSFGSEGFFDLGLDLSSDGLDFPANIWVNQLNRWQQPGDVTNIPRADINTGNQITSTRFLYDESFIRLQNVSLTYSLPDDIEENLNLNDLSLNITGQNLWVFTDWPGYDPTSEVYPVPRIITFGASVSF
ncbi:SusC/RagA family TonB-linked outer membrane protein [Aquimarina gracilis]|uniref:SusC/RagA family TonB-linked outer membrane protein n=1 Tax=Aquimarina gracilis TaxID=874422 RepID=A0ABU5ZSN4_9FLAO|nr:SusC/RagA family TonB-linked outer membrane protein [Aquimarina gracilis]MEB3345095.1 SusC/RagA family TonB-linked outer membrane protein [Aquimarina gracilis]